MMKFDRIGFLSEMQEHCSVSGREDDLARYLFSTCGIFDEIDGAGNLIARTEGRGKKKKKILLEAHLDEVGLVISEITPDGFLKVQKVGGVDLSILPGTGFDVFGKEKIFALAGQTPPHLLKGAEKEKTDPPLFLDAGFTSRKEAEEFVRIGDPVHYRGEAEMMRGGRILARGLDNKAGVVAALEAYMSLEDPENDVTLLLSVGEETTSRGVRYYTERETADLAVVVDAGFARAKGLDPTHCIEMDGGPSVSLTDTLHTGLARWAVQVASESGLPCQIICEPGGTGTNATAIQIRKGGIPSVVVSFPLLHMHTPSEIVSEKDLDDTSAFLLTLISQSEIPVGKERLK